MSDFCVIGSGPSAISAAMALVGRGLGVTMLDAGRALEDSRRESVARLGAQPSANWNEADIRSLKEGIEVSSDGIPLKRLYGSDFPFRTDGSEFCFDYIDAGVRPSFARGGLSTVWGAGLLPFHGDDIADWPFDAAELDAGYRGVLSFVPCSGSRDALDDLFPHHSTKLQTFPPGRQGAAFLRDAARAQARLSRDGIVVGQSRLAVDAERCERCGMCLYGCPYELIYSSEFTLRKLQKLPRFRYVPGVVVERLQEENGSVRIIARDLTTQAPRQFEASRVFLGAGTISSTVIILSSLGEYDVRVRLRDSFYFLLPLLRFAGVPDPGGERLHTLAQAFIALRNPEVCAEFVHFSIYGYNDLLIPSLRASIGAAGGLQSLASRILVAGGYLHSKRSPSLWLTVRPGRITIQGEDSSGAIAIAKKAAKKLVRQTARLRALPLIAAMRFPPPGRGFHTGGSFPMSKERVRMTSDTEGRPHGFERVHLIDASCLPSIPATTVTLPVMANAWRIASRVAERT
ncbi:MAG TPA: GMC oxidoreductase [Bryobacteraceae bacterium]|nr:GMC oxidoreductase [Bryobacteraceae bacterium]